MNIFILIKGEGKNQRNFIKTSLFFMLSLLENVELNYVLNWLFNYYLNVALLLLISNFLAFCTQNVIYMLSVLWQLVGSCCHLDMCMEGTYINTAILSTSLGEEKNQKIKIHIPI